MYLDLEFIKNVLGQLPVNIFFKDKNLRYLFSSHYDDNLSGSNNKDSSILGKTDEQLRKNSLNAKISHDTDMSVIKTQKGTSYIIEEELNGQKSIFEIIKNPVFNKKNQFIGIVGIVIDITERVNDKHNLNVYSQIDALTGLYSKNGFLSQMYKKLAQYRSHNISSVLIALSYLGNDNKDIDYSSFMFFSNALRFPVIENKISARISSNVFTVLLINSKNDSPEKTVAKFISDLKNSITRYTEGLSGYTMPEIAAEWTVLAENNGGEGERALNELEERLSKTISGVKNSFNSYKNVLYDLRSEIYDHPENDWNITEIAKKIGVSKSHFYRMYKKIHITSCTDDIIDARLKKACRLLIETDLRVSDISLRCGYKRESFFMRQFRSKIGMTAVQYRNKYK